MWIAYSFISKKKSFAYSSICSQPANGYGLPAVYHLAIIEELDGQQLDR
jgi:hypothetical protein